jgi:hypothetical protein
VAAGLSATDDGPQAGTFAAMLDEAAQADRAEAEARGASRRRLQRLRVAVSVAVVACIAVAALTLSSREPPTSSQREVTHGELITFDGAKASIGIEYLERSGRGEPAATTVVIHLEITDDGWRIALVE